MQAIETPDSKKYFHIIPNMADDDLDPYEYRLYGHYLRVGKCFESTRTTAKNTKMSVGKVSTTRQSLEEKGYVILHRHESGPIYVEIIDRWPENMERYKRSPDEQTEDITECSPDEQCVHHMNNECSPHEQCVHDMNQRITYNSNTNVLEGDAIAVTDVTIPADAEKEDDAIPEEAYGVTASEVAFNTAVAQLDDPLITNVVAVVVKMAEFTYGVKPDYRRVGSVIKAADDDGRVSRAAARRVVRALYDAGSVNPPPADMWAYVQAMTQIKHPEVETDDRLKAALG